jgi:glucose/arabinose dehydrogenase
MWATFHGADVRGSRGIFNDVDYLVKVEEGAWYGWPDYFNGKPATDPAFDSPGSEQPTFLLQEHPRLSFPFATFDPHSGANGLAFSPGESFWFDESAFVAAFGTFTPITTGPNVELSGFNVLMVNMNTGIVNTFAENKSPGPAYINRQGGFNRPSDVLFGPDESMYVVDWGGLVLTERGLENQEQTGVIWRIYNTETQSPKYAENRIVIPADPLPDEERDPLVRNASESYRQVLSRLWPVGLALLLLLAAVAWYGSRKR